MFFPRIVLTPFSEVFAQMSPSQWGWPTRTTLLPLQHVPCHLLSFLLSYSIFSHNSSNPNMLCNLLTCFAVYWKFPHPCACMLDCFSSRPTLCDPMDLSPPGSSVHGILQARIPEWVAMPSCRGPSWPCVFFFSCVSCVGKWVLYC